MRRTRLVILPGARCLTNMCALLLYLSCPNIGALCRERIDMSRDDLYFNEIMEMGTNDLPVKLKGMCNIDGPGIGFENDYTEYYNNTDALCYSKSEEDEFSSDPVDKNAYLNIRLNGKSLFFNINNKQKSRISRVSTNVKTEQRTLDLQNGRQASIINFRRSNNRRSAKVDESQNFERKINEQRRNVEKTVRVLNDIIRKSPIDLKTNTEIRQQRNVNPTLKSRIVNRFERRFATNSRNSDLDARYSRGDQHINRLNRQAETNKQIRNQIIKQERRIQKRESNKSSASVSNRNYFQRFSSNIIMNRRDLFERKTREDVSKTQNRRLSVENLRFLPTKKENNIDLIQNIRLSTSNYQNQEQIDKNSKELASSLVSDERRLKYNDRHMSAIRRSIYNQYLSRNLNFTPNNRLTLRRERVDSKRSQTVLTNFDSRRGIREIRSTRNDNDIRLTRNGIKEINYKRNSQETFTQPKQNRENRQMLSRSLENREVDQNIRVERQSDNYNQNYRGEYNRRNDMSGRSDVTRKQRTSGNHNQYYYRRLDKRNDIRRSERFDINRKPLLNGLFRREDKDELRKNKERTIRRNFENINDHRYRVLQDNRHNEIRENINTINRADERRESELRESVNRRFQSIRRRQTINSIPVEKYERRRDFNYRNIRNINARYPYDRQVDENNNMMKNFNRKIENVNSELLILPAYSQRDIRLQRYSKPARRTDERFMLNINRRTHRSETQEYSIEKKIRSVKPESFTLQQNKKDERLNIGRRAIFNTVQFNEERREEQRRKEIRLDNRQAIRNSMGDMRRSSIRSDSLGRSMRRQNYEKVKITMNKNTEIRGFATKMYSGRGFQLDTLNILPIQLRRFNNLSERNSYRNNINLYQQRNEMKRSSFIKEGRISNIESRSRAFDKIRDLKNREGGAINNDRFSFVHEYDNSRYQSRVNILSKTENTKETSNQIYFNFDPLVGVFKNVFNSLWSMNEETKTVLMAGVACVLFTAKIK